MTTNEDLETVRDLTSAIKSGDDLSKEDLVLLASAFIRLDMGQMDGVGPDGWNLSKFSKSRAGE